MLPAAIEVWDSYYSYMYRYSYYSNSTGTGSIVEDSCYTSRQKDVHVAPPYSCTLTRTARIHQAVSGRYQGSNGIISTPLIVSGFIIRDYILSKSAPE